MSAALGAGAPVFWTVVLLLVFVGNALCALVLWISEERTKALFLGVYGFMFLVLAANIAELTRNDTIAWWLVVASALPLYLTRSIGMAPKGKANGHGGKPE